MKETVAQSFIIQSVRNASGAANKLSNRFMIGVSDLLVKLPSRPALLVEVKMQHVGVTTSVAHQFKLDVTVPQVKFLSDYHAAGMPVCIMSLVERGGKGRRDLYAAVFKLDTLVFKRYVVAVCDHVQVPISKAGESVIISLLEGITYG